MEARKWGMAQILDIQREVNEMALKEGKPVVDILNEKEVCRINYLISQNTWPDKWSGDEPTADTQMDVMYSNGLIQPSIKFGE